MNILKENFVQLHNHTNYSLLDGAVDIKKMVKKAKANGQKALAITDHGNLHGHVKFQKACEAEGIKPILGCEVYIAPNSRFDREAAVNKNTSLFVDARYHHLILLVKDEIGYQNLNKLVYLSNKEGFYYKPRIDFELLEQYHEGLVCTSACLGGAVPQAYLRNAQNNSSTEICPQGYAAAKEIAMKYHAIFKDDFYLELQNHRIEDQQIIIKVLLQLSKELGIKFILTNDTHYVEKTDAEMHDILMRIQIGAKVNETVKMEFETDEFYLKSYEEMREVFPGEIFDEGFLNTGEIADKCNFQLEFGNYHLPKYEIPENYTCSFDYLRDLTLEGLEEKYSKTMDVIPQEYYERLESELDIINSMGFVDYFLIVWDFIKYATDNGIAVGPGRGSAAGSITSYALNITDTDPMKYDLLFERFLNPERVSMPDIDIDFCSDRRQEVIDYVFEKYGDENVAQIATFGTLSSKAVVKDVARVFETNGEEVLNPNFLTKLMKPHASGTPISEMLEINVEFSSLYQENNLFKKVVDIAMQLEGFPRHVSTHAAGVVISDKPITNYVGTFIKDGIHTTQFDMIEIEELGLLKMDFLGLGNLTILQNTERLVNQRLIREHKEYCDKNNIAFNENDVELLDFSQIPEDDPKTFELFSAGDTTGTFQVESSGMKDVLKELKPRSIEELTAVISLYRPGPMDSIPQYIFNKENPNTIVFKHDLLKPILENTYGVIVYQEQVMRVFRDLGGFSLGRADIVRRAMSKKKLDVMEKEEHIFIHGLRDEQNQLVLDQNGQPVIPGALSKGVSEKDASDIVDEMAAFAKYAFNKSHAAAYAKISYQTGYGKTHYPVEYMTSFLSDMIGSDSERLNFYIDSVQREMGIQVKSPDIEISEEQFSTDGKDIYYGLLAVKKVGSSFIQNLIEERKNGTFKSFFDFVYRMCDKDLNIGSLEALIKAGALDKFGNRNTLLFNAETFLEEAKAQKTKYQNGLSLFQMMNNIDYEKEREPELVVLDPLSIELTLMYEYEVLSFYASGHPFDVYYKHPDVITVDDLDKLKDGMKYRNVFMIAQIGAKRDILTKNNDNMSFLTLNGVNQKVDGVLFPRQFAKNNSILLMEDTNGVFLLNGDIDERNGGKQFIVNDVYLPIKEEEDFNDFLRNNKIKIKSPVPKVQKKENRYKKGLYIKVPKIEDYKNIAIATKEFYQPGEIPFFIYDVSQRKLITVKGGVHANFAQHLLSNYDKQTVYIK